MIGFRGRRSGTLLAEAHHSARGGIGPVYICRVNREVRDSSRAELCDHGRRTTTLTNAVESLLIIAERVQILVIHLQLDEPKPDGRQLHRRPARLTKLQ